MIYIVEIAALVIAAIALVGVARQKKNKLKRTTTRPGQGQQPTEPEPAVPEPTKPAQAAQPSQPEEATALRTELLEQLAEAEQARAERSLQTEQTEVSAPEQPEAPPSVPLATPEEPERTEPRLPEQPRGPESLAPEQAEQAGKPAISVAEQTALPEGPQSVPLAELGESEQTEPHLPEQTDYAEPLTHEQPEQSEAPHSMPIAEPENPEASHLPEKSEESQPLAPEQPERPEVPQPAEESDGPAPSRIDQVARYVPSIRTPQTTKRRPASQRTTTSGTRHRPIVLPVCVRVVFGRRSTVQVSLLPARNSELEEEIQVNGPDGEETWLASQDEWYGDSFRSDIERCLANGMRWTSDDASWLLRPRDLYVLAPNSTIFGFVSVTRLLLNENHLVLCRIGIQESVREELHRSGCYAFECMSAHGVPDGWVLFSEVRPTTAVDHDESAGILNSLRPIGEVEVYLHGGIRLSHNNWLHGHPPRIRVRGNSSDTPVVSIDGEAASIAEDGSYRTPEAFTLGEHIVFCEGATTPFAIVEGQNEWDLFVAYEYSIGRTRKTEISICGPTVMGHGEQTLVPATNSCLLGAQPGEIYFCQPAYDQAANDLLAITDFPVAWALPDNPYQCNKTKIFAQSTANIAVGAVKPHLGVRPSYQLLRWCNAILNSSRKGLLTNPTDNSVAELWSGYVRAARQLKRSMR